jgi:hypothetical protein
MQNTSEQASTKEFLKSVFSYFQFLGRNWQLLLIALLIGNYYDFIKNSYFKKAIDFGAEIEFNIDLEGNAQNQMGGIAASFGLPGGGGGNSGLLDITNFEKVLFSKAVFNNAFMTEVELYGRKDLFVNFFIDSSDIRTNEWGAGLFRSASSYGEYKFTKKDPKDFTQYENQLLSDIFIKLEKQTKLLKIDGSSIYKLTGVLTEEHLTKAWLETLLTATEQFYTSIKTAKTRKMITIQSNRVDSLSNELRKTDRGLAKTTFEQPDVVNPSAMVTQSKLSRDNTYLTNVYVSNLTSLENLKNLLIEQEPMFHILTPITLPLSASNKVGISLRLSGLILLVATIIIISLRKSYLDIMNED